MKPEKIKRNFKDIHFLKLAIRHGHRSIGMTWPNPPVGCIIVKDNKIIGRGSTGENGIPHAEIKALKEAGEFSKNSDLYCSLEPCSHHGKTPPCVDEIIKNKISRVIIPFLDPNPLVKGNGIKVLKEAGIKVVILKELEQKAYELIKGFNYFIQKKRPFITLKIATSLDGMISTKHGTSKWISNSFSRERVQYLRYINDAILVGTNTAKKDKPSLKIRNGLKIYKQPKRCFIDTKLSLEPKDLNSSPDYIFYSSKLSPQKKLKWDDYKTTLIQIKNKNDHLDVVDIVKKFYELKFHYVLIEGGGLLASSFLKENLIDQLIHYGTGLIIGSNGTPCISEILKNSKNINDFPRLKLKSVRNIKGDIETIWENISKNTS